MDQGQGVCCSWASDIIFIIITKEPMNSNPGQQSQFHKIIVIGDSNVGKTNLIHIFDKGRKPLAANPTIGVEFTAKVVTVPDRSQKQDKDWNRRVKAQIWDTAGQEQFRAIAMSHYRNAHGAMVVYDVTNRNSFEHVREWLAAVQERADPLVQVILVANKCDSTRRAVSRAEGQSLANSSKALYAETNFNEPQSVKVAFVSLLGRVADVQFDKKTGESVRLARESLDSGCEC